MEEPQQQPGQTNKQGTKGYGKRPAWQWVLIYLVAAAVVYGLIYYIFIHNGSSSTGY